MRIETDLDSDKVYAIEKHYLKAREKHPYFCDSLYPRYYTKDQAKRRCENELEYCRDLISEMASESRLQWDALLNCEVWEAHEAIANGATAAAVEECYDAIAVLLRVVDVLEGRQALGRPDECEVAE